MSNPDFSYNKYLNKKSITRGLAAFIIITVGVFTALFFQNEGIDYLNIWKSIKAPYFLLALFFVFNDLYLGGLRNHIFFARNYPELSQMVSIRANLANLFMGSVTPSQTGGGPTQWYVWYRAGIKVKDIIETSFFNFLSTVAFFPIAGGISMYMLKDKMPPGLAFTLIKVAFTVFGLFFIILVALLYSPDWMQRILRWIQRLIANFTDRYDQRLTSFSTKTAALLQDYQRTFIDTIRKSPMLLFWSFVITIVMYYNKFILAYVLALAFGVEGDFVGIVSVLAVCYMFLYFAPSPGGAGIAEVSIAGMLAHFMTKDFALSVTLLHRSFLIFIPAILGGIVVVQEVRRHARSIVKQPND